MYGTISAKPSPLMALASIEHSREHKVDGRLELVDRGALGAGGAARGKDANARQTGRRVYSIETPTCE